MLIFLIFYNVKTCTVTPVYKKEKTNKKLQVIVKVLIKLSKNNLKKILDNTN